MSAPTPRTDAAQFIQHDMTAVVDADFARTLERELAAERAKVRTLRDACEAICEEWGKNHDANAISAAGVMYTTASSALDATEDAP